MLNFSYSMPLEFWRILHAKYGIIVYPTALVDEDERIPQINQLFTEAYHGHVSKFIPKHRKWGYWICQYWTVIVIVSIGRVSQFDLPPDGPISFLQHPRPHTRNARADSRIWKRTSKSPWTTDHSVSLREIMSYKQPFSKLTLAW